MKPCASGATHSTNRSIPFTKSSKLAQLPGFNPYSAKYVAIVSRRPGDSAFRAFKLDVVRVRDGRIAEVTTFDATLFAAFGLPEVL